MGTEHELDLLRDDFATRIDIGNDAVGTLQVNLDHERRTTICVTVEAINSTIDPSVDVYLMTDTQYDRYSAAYDVAHGYWSWDNHRDDDDQLDEVPPNGGVSQYLGGLHLEIHTSMRTLTRFLSR